MSSQGLVFFTGWSFSKEYTERFLAKLAPSLDCICIDTLSFLKIQEKEITLDTAAIAAHVNALRSKQSSSILHIAGWSLGGIAAVDYLLSQNSEFETLTLINSTTDFIEDKEERRNSFLKLFTSISTDDRRVLNSFYGTLLKERADWKDKKPTVEELYTQSLSFTHEELLQGLEYLKQGMNKERLSHINIPTYVVCGKEDLLIPPSHSALLQSCIPGASIRILDGYSHLLPFQNLFHTFSHLKFQYMNTHLTSHFSRAAHTYHKNALVHRRAAEYLISHSPALQGSTDVLDLGSGTGIVSEQLAGYCKESSISNFDISAEMLNVARHSFPESVYIQGDLKNHTLAPDYSYVFSNMALQWLENPYDMVECISKCLAPSGKFSVSIVLKGTFSLLSQIRERVLTISNPSCSHIETQTHKLPELQALKNAFSSSSQIRCTRIECHTFHDYFESIERMFKSIKQLGISGSSERILSKKQFSLLCSLYEEALSHSNKKPHLDYVIGFFWGERCDESPN